MVSNAACSQLQSASHSSPLSDETLLTNVMCGVLSGVISSSIANPTDVLKVAICTHEDSAGSPCCCPSEIAVSYSPNQQSRFDNSLEEQLCMLKYATEKQSNLLYIQQSLLMQP